MACYTEKAHNLPSGTCHAFAERESAYRYWVYRVEKSYVEMGGTYAKNVRKEAMAFAKAHNYQPSYYTEIFQLGTSWTMYQIMGINLRRYGFAGNYMNEITLEAQFEMFGRFLEDLVKRFGFEGAVSAYNHGRPWTGFDEYRDGPRGVLTRQKYWSTHR